MTRTCWAPPRGLHRGLHQRAARLLAPGECQMGGTWQPCTCSRRGMYRRERTWDKVIRAERSTVNEKPQDITVPVRGPIPHVSAGWTFHDVRIELALHPSLRTKSKRVTLEDEAATSGDIRSAPAYMHTCAVRNPQSPRCRHKRAGLPCNENTPPINPDPMNLKETETHIRDRETFVTRMPVSHQHIIQKAEDEGNGKKERVNGGGMGWIYGFPQQRGKKGPKDEQSPSIAAKSARQASIKSELRPRKEMFAALHRPFCEREGRHARKGVTPKATALPHHALRAGSYIACGV
ncbi:hypothetical protein C8F04DRAFT_1196051 [Mycena alexandri]|uniref:Uncharacterized protein n=1 Tax=Mycena alexandri TaxID=1745969 RepID=A0AAD6S495_9AGAR|nr:hypothetical protein C8F04DRAFT_1196051 [Mycena alexandri]